MGDGVAARVAHLVFFQHLGHVLHLVGESGLYAVLLGLVLHHQLEALHMALQVVAGMLHVGAHAQVL